MTRPGHRKELDCMKNETKPDRGRWMYRETGNTSRCVRRTFVDCVWNVMAHAQKPDFVFRQNRRVHLNRRGRQFSRLLAGEFCTSACRVCTARASLCSAVMWRLLVTHPIRQFPLHFSRAPPCAVTFQLDSTSAVVSSDRVVWGCRFHWYASIKVVVVRVCLYKAVAFKCMLL